MSLERNNMFDIDKLLMFKHELLSSLEVNDIVQYIPNYIYCFGGFICKSDPNFKNLCVGKQQTSYLLLENVKNSNTLYRTIRTSTNLAPQDESQQTLDAIYQIMVSLMFGYNIKNLHITICISIILWCMIFTKIAIL